MCDSCNAVRQWLPSDTPETREYDWFVENFGSEEMVLVSWPGCTIDDERLDRLADSLSEWTVSATRGPGGVDQGRRGLLQRVITGRQLVQELTEQLEISQTAALRRLRGFLIGPDDRATALVALVSPEGADDRDAVVATIYRSAETAAGLRPEDLRLAGPTVQSVALVQESHRSRVTLSGIAVVLVSLLAWRCLNSGRLAVIVISTAVYCGMVSLSALYFTGGSMNLVMVMMPVLVFVLAISAAIHLANYYREAVAEGAGHDAVGRAMANGWAPCTLSACTTAVGLGSLAVSELTPVRMFGIYSALGVLLSLALLLLGLPAALQMWGPRRQASARDARGRAGNAGWAAALAKGVTRHHLWVVSLTAATVVIVAAGLPRLNMSVKLLNLFSPTSRFIQDVAWLEEHLGPVVPIEVVIRFDRDNPLAMIDRLELVRCVQTEIEKAAEVGGTMSVATFAPAVPRGRGMRQSIRRSAVKARLENLRDRFGEARYLATSGGEELWRVSARVAELNSIDYADFVQQLRSRVDPIVETCRLQCGGGVEATTTGLVPLFYKAQRLLLADMISSLRLSLVLIAIVMVVMLRSIFAGLVSMPANVLPIVVIFGGMGWAGRLCDIGSMMTASVALGIAVDDTIHFLSWFRRGIRANRSRKESIQLAYRRCAGAMMQTTAICGLGLLAYAFSSFMPTARFAWLMCTLLVAALAGDLLLLPSILAGPLGKPFERESTLVSTVARRLSAAGHASLVHLPRALAKSWSPSGTVQQSA
jgi:predicted RND superfamily exporter protein